jgi:hypothetical protein
MLFTGEAAYYERDDDLSTRRGSFRLQQAELIGAL